MTVLQVQDLYGERRHYLCPLGVLYANLRVSLKQMSRWRAQIHSLMEKNPCRVLTMRKHQSRLRVDKDNPSTGQVQKAMNQSKAHEQRTGSATETKLGTYLYGILILCGLVIHDQTERLRREYGSKAGNGINPMIGHMIWFWDEWLQMDNIKLIGILIGVAIIVPTAISPLDFARQIVGRTLVSGRLACIWIHRQINTIYQQGLHSCNFLVQSLTVHFWLIRSTNQGASYGWDPGPPV
jgi:regulator of replication initiation timing